ncbi:hypothetical protein RKD27_002911 [Streptomyces sp. SAI-126]|nr:hypothetical protein [Streptomyces sp. SAI-119]MDH6496517.1 hypothetical protein [Streptomyces sp. SAI-149]GLP72022.1 hypothetical protein TUSST3_86410 [Streptomyces sp. TUS-ST3]
MKRRPSNRRNTGTPSARLGRGLWGMFTGTTMAALLAVLPVTVTVTLDSGHVDTLTGGSCLQPRQETGQGVLAHG